ncbi:uncharacterized protein LOC106879890 isoform X2 [Octopus bimaculoides]|uniref:uncharacterized protein LOC106879890 isoform X2 n=1 Tax=Octopus bimaculoides TaxID=37653 RepID=UPI00071D1FAC|nr:uncharacterized protein LOC106879890 isoform X2 [Octopus bimaculoides]|eukprot:XP_014785113.1 PREDICTED: uncharacterized protein LOC106879890 isoform X2 [Octopus bimaculoides]
MQDQYRSDGVAENIYFIISHQTFKPKRFDLQFKDFQRFKMYKLLHKLPTIFGLWLFLFQYDGDASMVAPITCPLKFISNMSMDDSHPMGSAGGNLTHCIKMCQMENLCQSFKADSLFKTCYFSTRPATSSRLIPANDSMVVTVEGSRDSSSHSRGQTTKLIEQEDH